jgi:hypothetical protein
MNDSVVTCQYICSLFVLFCKTRINMVESKIATKDWLDYGKSDL